MSDPCCPKLRSQISSRAFLLSQSDVCEPLPAHGPAADASAAQTIQALSSQPEPVLAPSRLMDAAMTRLADADRFAVLILGMDHFSRHPEPETLVSEIAGITREKCLANGGFWGVFDADKLACFFPGSDQSAGTDLARSLQQDLARKGTQTLTIGISAYPLLDFDRSEILINAQKALEHAEFFGPGSCTAFDAVSLNISGDKYYQAGDIEGAIAEFRRALAMDPENVNVYNSLGVCYGVKEEMEAALECFNRAADLDPAEIMALYNAGYTHMCRGEHERALEFFQKAGLIDANVFEVAFQTGRVYLETSRPEKARKYLETAVKCNEKSGIAFRYLADCYLLLDRETDAAAAYTTVLKLRPDDAEALSALGYLYEEQGKNADIALMFCRRAAEMAPENGLFRHRLGRLYYHRNCWEQALAEFEAATACGHDSSEYIALARDMGAAPDADRRVRG